MSKDTARVFEEVCRHARRTAVMASIHEFLGWDERTMLPPGGAEHRAEQSTLLAGMIHQRWVDYKFGEQLDGLAADSADNDDSDAAVIVRRLKRQRDKRVKLPQSLVEELSRTAVMGQQAWQEARNGDDFAMFQPLLSARSN